MFPPPRSTPIDQAEKRFLPALAATARIITLRPMRAFLFHEMRKQSRELLLQFGRPVGSDRIQD